MCSKTMLIKKQGITKVDIQTDKTRKPKVRNKLFSCKEEFYVKFSTLNQKDFKFSTLNHNDLSINMGKHLDSHPEI